MFSVDVVKHTGKKKVWLKTGPAPIKYIPCARH